MKSIRKLGDVIDRICRWFCLFALSAITIMVAYQVIVRKLGSSVTWVDEVARYLFVLLILFGTVIVSREGDHIQIVTLLDKLPKTLRKVADLAIYTSVLAFDCIFCYGVFYTMQNAGDVRFSVLTSIKMQYFYAICLVALIFCAFATIVYMIDIVTTDVHEKADAQLPSSDGTSNGEASL